MATYVSMSKLQEIVKDRETWRASVHGRVRHTKRLNNNNALHCSYYPDWRSNYPIFVHGGLFLLLPEFFGTTPVVFYGFLLFWYNKISNRTFSDDGNVLCLHSMML